MSCKARCLVRSLLRRDPTERLTADDVLYHPWLAQTGSNTNTQSNIGDHELPAHAHYRMQHSHHSSHSTQNSDQVVPVWLPPENNSDDEN